jgi:hypothetical protein
MARATFATGLYAQSRTEPAAAHAGDDPSREFIDSLH